MKRAYFCIDGFSFKRINDFYKHEHSRHSRLNIAALETYLRYEIARRLDLKSDPENLTIEKHFYHPNESPQRNFENNLTDSGYSVHYTKENIFADWAKAREFTKFDIFALLSTQKQYADIFKQTRLCNIPSILIGWDTFCKNSAGENSRWKTDKHLIENASIYCPLDKTLNLPNNKHPIVEIMFENFFSFYPQQPAVYPKYPLNLRCG